MSIKTPRGGGAVGSEGEPSSPEAQPLPPEPSKVLHAEEAPASPPSCAAGPSAVRSPRPCLAMQNFPGVRKGSTAELGRRKKSIHIAGGIPCGAEAEELAEWSLPARCCVPTPSVSREAAEEEDALLGSAWRALGLPEDALWAPG